MAAHLKKRAFAEFSQVIQEEAPTTSKKLRLIHKTKGPEPQLNFQTGKTPQEVLQILTKFEEEYMPVNSEHAETIVRLLLDHFYSQEDAVVRTKIASMLSELAKTPRFKSSMLVDDITTMFTKEESHKVKSQLMATLTVIGQTNCLDRKLHQVLISMARKQLTDTNHTVRTKCLELIGALARPDLESEKPEETEKSPQQILDEYSRDTDPRVRTSAFKALIQWHQRGIKLPEVVYGQVCKALNDEYEGVRLAAVKLIWVLSHLFPETKVKIESEEIRLVDDGFAKICNMVNDVSMQVRRESASLLGSLHQVSKSFRDQTLDKKLMSNLRKKTTAHERQREHYQTGEWSTGKKWADDAPKENLSVEEVSIMSSGACGAFVHTFEDEFMEVRNAAIDSLCELATQSASFANQSQDFLVDMFNDEIESVRLNAIHSVRKIAHHISLREDQLEIIVSVLKDFNPEIREAVHEMFRRSGLSTKGSLNACVMALLNNLSLYPQDKLSIWKTMQQLGIRHPALTLALQPELLCVHRYFDTPEPDMDDPAYVSVLILVLNAAKSLPTMIQMFPEHVVNHYTYLRDSLPHLVPEIKFPGKPLQETKCTADQHKMTELFMEKTGKRLESVVNMDHKGAEQLISIVIKDLDRVCDVDLEAAASAECSSLMLQCQLHLLKLKLGSNWDSSCLSQPQHRVLVSSMADKVLKMTGHMESVFVGLSAADVANIRQLRVRAQALQLLLKLTGDASDVKSSCVHFLKCINQLQRFMSSSNLSPDSLTTVLLSSMHRLETVEPSEYSSVLQDCLTHHKISVPKLQNQLKRAQVNVLEPSGTYENILKFTAGLTVCVPFIAEIAHVESIQNLRLKVKYPDQQEELIIPRASDLRQISPLRHRLNTQVLLSHGIWSEPCNVELSVVLCYSPDKDLNVETPDKQSKMFLSSAHVIELTPAIKVELLPKTARH